MISKVVFNETLFKLCKYRHIKVEVFGNHYILSYKKTKTCEFFIDFSNDKVKEVKYISTTKEIKEYKLTDLYNYLETELKNERLLKRLKASGRPIKKYKTFRRKLVEMGREELRRYAMRQNRRFGIKRDF